ncbi:hypothetical protein QYF36_017005 [Acer negundo]|nr:hypothetical protein QYF36_017005 [Acer negundo]
MDFLSSQLEFSSMDKQKDKCCISFVLSLVVVVLFLCNNGWFAIARADQTGYISAVGDPGMKRDSLRVAIESWNQCNEEGEEVPNIGSPRAADCFDIYQAPSTQSNCPFGPDNGFPCFGEGYMNQPLIYHDYTTLQGANKTTLRGRFFGSWDLNADLSKGLVGNISWCHPDHLGVCPPYHTFPTGTEIFKGPDQVA